MTCACTVVGVRTYAPESIPRQIRGRLSAPRAPPYPASTEGCVRDADLRLSRILGGSFESGREPARSRANQMRY